MVRGLHVILSPAGDLAKVWDQGRVLIWLLQHDHTGAAQRTDWREQRRGWEHSHEVPAGSRSWTAAALTRMGPWSGGEDRTCAGRKRQEGLLMGKGRAHEKEVQGESSLCGLCSLVPHRHGHRCWGRRGQRTVSTDGVGFQVPALHPGGVSGRQAELRTRDWPLGDGSHHWHLHPLPTPWPDDAATVDHENGEQRWPGTKGRDMWAGPCMGHEGPHEGGGGWGAVGVGWGRAVLPSRRQVPIHGRCLTTSGRTGSPGLSRVQPRTFPTLGGTDAPPSNPSVMTEMRPGHELLYGPHRGPRGLMRVRSGCSGGS